MSATFPAPASTAPDLSPGQSLGRAGVLAAVLDPRRLPTPPAVALQVVNAASRPDCRPAEIVALLSMDPALCAKLLKAVNSCVYGLSKPVASLDRAVAVLGLGAVRSLALGLSLPAVRAGATDEETRAYSVASVGGAIMARELAALARRPGASDDLVAGLLRDLGRALLRQTYPDAWRAMRDRHGDRLVTDPCDAEEETFGVHHADVTAELLRGWNLPEDIVEPIRHHHAPDRLTAGPLADRAELLYLADLLTDLDAVVRFPRLVDRVLGLARDRFGLAQPGLIKFLKGVAPKVEEFSRLLKQDIGQCPDFAAILAAGAAELVNLTVESNRERLGGSGPVPNAPRAPARTPPPAGDPLRTAWCGDAAAATWSPGRNNALPGFHPSFLEELPLAGCRLGDYELRERIGRGAMGVVFRAYEPSLDRFVAVKLLAPQLAADTVARQRFTREARAAASVQQENVVAVYAVREESGVPYLAMEYVEGEALDLFLDPGPPPVLVAVRIGRQVAAGLAAAHAKGIVHRDIKPANVLLRPVGNRRPGAAAAYQVKITDFGLARVADDAKLSTDGALLGTPHFMSPEQLDGKPAGPLSDLFSLGGVLYALCTGELPFPGTSLTAVLRAVSECDPVPPRSLRPAVPAWLEEVVLKLLRKDPAARFRSADEVAAVLAEHGG